MAQAATEGTLAPSPFKMNEARSIVWQDQQGWRWPSHKTTFAKILKTDTAKTPVTAPSHRTHHWDAARSCWLTGCS